MSTPRGARGSVVFKATSPDVYTSLESSSAVSSILSPKNAEEAQQQLSRSERSERRWIAAECRSTHMVAVARLTSRLEVVLRRDIGRQETHELIVMCVAVAENMARVQLAEREQAARRDLGDRITFRSQSMHVASSRSFRRRPSGFGSLGRSSSFAQGTNGSPLPSGGAGSSSPWLGGGVAGPVVSSFERQEPSELLFDEEENARDVLVVDAQEGWFRIVLRRIETYQWKRLHGAAMGERRGHEQRPQTQTAATATLPAPTLIAASLLSDDIPQRPSFCALYESLCVEETTGRASVWGEGMFGQHRLACRGLDRIEAAHRRGVHQEELAAFVPIGLHMVESITRCAVEDAEASRRRRIVEKEQNSRRAAGEAEEQDTAVQRDRTAPSTMDTTASASTIVSTPSFAPDGLHVVEGADTPMLDGRLVMGRASADEVAVGALLGQLLPEGEGPSVGRAVGNEAPLPMPPKTVIDVQPSPENAVAKKFLPEPEVVDQAERPVRGDATTDQPATQALLQSEEPTSVSRPDRLHVPALELSEVAPAEPEQVPLEHIELQTRREAVDAERSTAVVDEDRQTAMPLTEQPASSITELGAVSRDEAAPQQADLASPAPPQRQTASCTLSEPLVVNSESIHDTTHATAREGLPALEVAEGNASCPSISEPIVQAPRGPQDPAEAEGMSACKVAPVVDTRTRVAAVDRPPTKEEPSMPTTTTTAGGQDGVGVRGTAAAPVQAPQTDVVDALPKTVAEAGRPQVPDSASTDLEERATGIPQCTPTEGENEESEEQRVALEERELDLGQAEPAAEPDGGTEPVSTEPLFIEPSEQMIVQQMDLNEVEPSTTEVRGEQAQTQHKLPATREENALAPTAPDGSHGSEDVKPQQLQQPQHHVLEPTDPGMQREQDHAEAEPAEHRETTTEPIDPHADEAEPAPLEPAADAPLVVGASRGPYVAELAPATATAETARNQTESVGAASHQDAVLEASIAEQARAAAQQGAIEREVVLDHPEATADRPESSEPLLVEPTAAQTEPEGMTHPTPAPNELYGHERLEGVVFEEEHVHRNDLHCTALREPQAMLEGQDANRDAAVSCADVGCAEQASVESTQAAPLVTASHSEVTQPADAQEPNRHTSDVNGGSEVPHPQTAPPANLEDHSTEAATADPNEPEGTHAAMPAHSGPAAMILENSEETDANAVLAEPQKVLEAAPQEPPQLACPEPTGEDKQEQTEAQPAEQAPTLVCNPDAEATEPVLLEPAADAPLPADAAQNVTNTSEPVSFAAAQNCPEPVRTEPHGADIEPAMQTEPVGQDVMGEDDRAVVQASKLEPDAESEPAQHGVVSSPTVDAQAQSQRFSTDPTSQSAGEVLPSVEPWNAAPLLSAAQRGHNLPTAPPAADATSNVNGAHNERTTGSHRPLETDALLLVRHEASYRSALQRTATELIDVLQLVCVQEPQGRHDIVRAAGWDHVHLMRLARQWVGQWCFMEDVRTAHAAIVDDEASVRGVINAAAVAEITVVVEEAQGRRALQTASDRAWTACLQAMFVGSGLTATAVAALQNPAQDVPDAEDNCNGGGDLPTVVDSPIRLASPSPMDADAERPEHIATTPGRTKGATGAASSLRPQSSLPTSQRAASPPPSIGPPQRPPSANPTTGVPFVRRKVVAEPSITTSQPTPTPLPSAASRQLPAVRPGSSAVVPPPGRRPAAGRAASARPPLGASVRSAPVPRPHTHDDNVAPLMAPPQCDEHLSASPQFFQSLDKALLRASQQHRPTSTSTSLRIHATTPSSRAAEGSMFSGDASTPQFSLQRPTTAASVVSVDFLPTIQRRPGTGNASCASVALRLSCSQGRSVRRFLSMEELLEDEREARYRIEVAFAETFSSVAMERNIETMVGLLSRSMQRGGTPRPESAGALHTLHVVPPVAKATTASASSGSTAVVTGQRFQRIRELMYELPVVY